MEQARVAGSDRVVEIGGGSGVLTQALARRAGFVTSIEVDERLAARLRRATAENPQVEVVTGDALEVPLPAEPFRVVANPPFNRTADLLRRLARETRLREAHLLVQLEAAERFAGAPFARETLQSLLLKPWWHVEIVGEVPATAFSPPPSVSVALLWMQRRDPPLLNGDEAAAYRALIERVFSQGQGLRDSLRRELSTEQLRRIAARLRIDLDGRRGDPTFDQWLALHRFIASRGNGQMTRLRWADGGQPTRGTRRQRSRRRKRGSARRSPRPGPRSPRADR